MTEYNPRTRYMFHAEALEESLMSLTRGDRDSWEDALADCLAYWRNSDALKVLSELSLDTTEAGATSRLFLHYADPDTRDAVITSWHAAGHYTQRETETC